MHKAQVNSNYLYSFQAFWKPFHEGLFIFGVEIQDRFSAASGPVQDSAEVY
jgi:hypothetical protein